MQPDTYKYSLIIHSTIGISSFLRAYFVPFSSKLTKIPILKEFQIFWPMQWSAKNYFTSGTWSTFDWLTLSVHTVEFIRMNPNFFITNNCWTFIKFLFNAEAIYPTFIQWRSLNKKGIDCLSLKAMPLHRKLNSNFGEP